MIFEKRWKQNTVIGLNLLVIVILCWWGMSNAIAAAHSKAIIRDAEAIVQGFEYFKKDQNRYPFSSEFNNVELLKVYLNNYPPQQHLTTDCETNLKYFSNSPDAYELSICLPKAAKGYPSGWSIFATK